MQRAGIAALALLASSVAQAADTVTCKGTLIDVNMKGDREWPYGVVYDIDSGRTCIVDRLNAGHDPFRGSCNVGGPCEIGGTYVWRRGQTFMLRNWTSRGPLDVETPAGK